MNKERQGINLKDILSNLRNRILPPSQNHSVQISTGSVTVEPEQSPSENMKLIKQPDEKQRKLILSYLEETRERIKDFNSEGRLVAILWDPLFKSVPHDAIVEVVKPTGDDLDLTIKALGPLLVGHFSGRVEHALRTYEHMLEKRRNGNQIAEQKKRSKSKVAGDNASPTDNNDPNTKDVSQTKPRIIVLEGNNTSKPFSANLDDEGLLREIRKSGSDISEEDLLKIFAYLQSGNKKDLLLKYTKRVLTGPFKDYRVIRRGDLGRVLFQIDKNDCLHIRIAKHDDIYAAMRKVS